MTIEDKLAEIQARSRAATPGPWSADDAGQDDWCVFGPSGQSIVDLAWDGSVDQAHEERGERSNCKNNAAFIAHARTDIEWLHAEVERLRHALTAVAAGTLMKEIHEVLEGS